MMRAALQVQLDHRAQFLFVCRFRLLSAALKIFRSFLKTDGGGVSGRVHSGMLVVKTNPTMQGVVLHQ